MSVASSAGQNVRNRSCSGVPARSCSSQMRQALQMRQRPTNCKQSTQNGWPQRSQRSSAGVARWTVQGFLSADGCQRGTAIKRASSHRLALRPLQRRLFAMSMFLCV